MNFKKLIPHIVAIVLFIAINIIMYWPMYLEDKSLNQNDILQGAGANQETIEHRHATGEEALWTNSMFSGMPTYLINTVWSGDLIKYIPITLDKVIGSPASHTFVAMTAFYILLLVFGLNPYLAICGGLVYGLNTFFLISVEAGHIWKVAAISWMPLVLAGIILTFQKKYLLGFIITALAMALEIRSNHYQITYYLLLIVLVFGIYKLYYAIKNNEFPQFAKAVGILIIAVGLGIGANFGKIWSAYEYGKFSIRGKAVLSSNDQSSGGLDRDYAFAWSNGIWEPFTFLIPNFYGGASQEEVSMDSDLAQGLKSRGAGSGQVRSFIKNVPTYWGNQPFTSGPYYLGAIVVFLFFLGAILVKGPIKWWLVTTTILGIVLSWGDNFQVFNYLMFDYFPGYNKFRAVSMTVIISFLSMALLGFLGIKEMMTLEWKDIKKQFFYASGTAAGLCLLMILVSFSLRFRGAVDAQLGDQQQWLVDLIREHRASMLRSDAFRSLFFILAAGAILYYWKQKRLSNKLAIATFSLLILVDYIPVGKRYLNEENFIDSPKSSFFNKTAANEKILEDNGHFRVLNLNNPFNEAKTSYFHSSIGGYHGAKMRRYQDLIDNRIQPEMAGLIENLRSGNTDLSSFGTINMLNAKYIKFGSQAGQVIQNTAAYGNAWFVNDVKQATSPDEVMASLATTDVKNTAIIDKNEFSLSQSNYGNGTIRLKKYEPNELIYTSNLQEKGLAVFSEVYYPLGWEATIDGTPVEILRANYILRALEVPAGEHEIIFKFRPNSYFIGNKIMLVSSIIIYLVIIGAIIMAWRKRS
ncbi:MAG: hypothetical protein DSY77_08380 [Bacteroidetes bacterium]|nr:MAG: hypothetical protein DSY77_08380 [Bacteroidota bacterium]